MKRFALGLLLLLPLSPACSDDSTASGATTPPPAPPGTPTPTGTPTPESKTPDPPAPFDTGVGVTVVRGGKPLTDVHVVFHDAAGEVVDDLTTDKDGKVSRAIASSMVTVLLPAPKGVGVGGDEIVQTPIDALTFTSIEEGDRLVVNADEPDANAVSVPVLTRYSVNLPGAVDAAASYQATAGQCLGINSAATTDPVEIVLFDPCLTDQGSVLLAALDDGGIPSSYAWKTGLGTPPAGVSTPVTPDPNAWSTPIDFDVSLANAPDGATLQASAFAVFGGVTHQLPTSPTATATNTFKAPATTAGGGYQASYIVDPGAGDNMRYAFAERNASGAALTIDASKTLPAVAATIQPAATTERPQIDILTSRPFTGADVTKGGAVAIDWTVTLTETTSEIHRWTFIVPPNVTTIKAPKLPDTVASWRPNAAAEFEIDGAVFVDPSNVADYKALRKLPVTSWSFPGTNVGVALPAAGTVRVTSFNHFITDGSPS